YRICHASVCSRLLPSFPTRRSSDLVVEIVSTGNIFWSPPHSPLWPLWHWRKPGPRFLIGASGSLLHFFVFLLQGLQFGLQFSDYLVSLITGIRYDIIQFAVQGLLFGGDGFHHIFL